MPLSGTDGLVPGALKPLLDMGRGRSSVNRATQSPAEGHSFCGELVAGVAMDRGERDEISRVQRINSGVNTCNRRLELFETASKVFAVPEEVRHVWSRMRFFLWF